MMIRSVKLLIHITIVLVVLSIPVTTTAQEEDLKLWTGIEFNNELSKKLKLSFGIEQRFDNNISDYDRFLFEPGISYKFNKRWRVNFKYRGWFKSTLEKKMDFRQRGKFSATYRISKKQFKIRLTSAIQYGIPDLNNENFNYTNDIVTRNNIKVSYDIFGTRFTPFTKYELFTSIKNYLKNYQWRFIIGTDYAISQSLSLVLFCAFEHEYNIVSPMDSYISGIIISYDI